MTRDDVDDPWLEGLRELVALLRKKGLRAKRFLAPSGRLLLERAEIELLRVHRLETARLLFRAARLSARRELLRDLSPWRLDCAAHLKLLAADGLACPEVLVACAHSPLSAWPALALARHAARLEPCRAHNALVAELTRE